MTPARFLEERGPAWVRMRDLVEKTGKKGAAALNEEELHELTRLYPAVAVDVARARMYKIDPLTQRKLNQLAIAAHGLLYRRKAIRRKGVLRRFFLRDYPRLFRRLWGYAVLAGAVFFVSALATYVAVRIQPSTVNRFVPDAAALVDREEGLTARDVSDRFRRLPSQFMAAAIVTNNISVAFSAFAFGIAAGLGTCLVLLINGMMLGGFAAHFANHGLSYPLWSFLAPHGVLEILAILIAATAGLRLGLSLAVPGSLTRKASLQAGAKEAVLLVLGTIPMFIIAGVVEGFVTPSELPGAAKIILGLMLGAAAMAYLLLAGHGRAGGAAPAGEKS